MMAADNLPRGTIIDGVNVQLSSGQTYALYLPTAYTPQRKWPALFIFDPLARGKVPVELFRAAAETFGYVVIASNNSRNGLPWSTTEQIIAALWNDAHARFSLDDARVYAAGFSGGARVANRLAALCHGCIAGVISCGAGLPTDVTPNKAMGYAFFGTVGVDDFNFREMRPLERALDHLGVTNRLVTFDGRHRWCPEDVCTEGIEWFELLAMRKGQTPTNDTIIDRTMARLSARADSLGSPERAYERYVALTAILTTLEGLRDVSRVRKEADALRASRQYQAALGEELRQLTLEGGLAAEILKAGEGLNEIETHNDALLEVRERLRPLREQSNRLDDSPDRRIARRTLAQLYAQTLESAQYYLEPQKEYRLAVASLELTAEIYPDIAQTEYELARALALDRRKRDAIEALSRAVQKGFSDATAIEREDAFAELRKESKYKELIEKMKHPHRDSRVASR